MRRRSFLNFLFLNFLILSCVGFHARPALHVKLTRRATQRLHPLRAQPTLDEKNDAEALSAGTSTDSGKEEAQAQRFASCRTW